MLTWHKLEITGTGNLTEKLSPSDRTIYLRGIFYLLDDAQGLAHFEQYYPWAGFRKAAKHKPEGKQVVSALFHVMVLITATEIKVEP